MPPFLAAQPLPRSADQRVRSGSYDHTIRLWDASQAAAVRTIYSSKRVVSCIGYSPLAKRLGTPWRVPAQALLCHQHPPARTLLRLWVGRAGPMIAAEQILK